jgi:hypothetical protein
MINEEIKQVELMQALRVLFKNQEELDSFILPEIGKPKRLPKFNKYCTDMPPSNLFIDSETIPYENFQRFIPRITTRSGETAPHGFNGLMLKIIIDYNVNNIQFRHLLIGGMYYQYGIATSIATPDNEIPVRTVMSGFF